MGSLTKKNFLQLFQLFSLWGVATGENLEDLTQFVNPFIGTEGQGYPGTAINSGNVFPGVALPFGVVKFGIDTTAFDWTNVDPDAGYTPDGYGKKTWALSN
jgi:putative alpha-1,2-mannosidase